MTKNELKYYDPILKRQVQWVTIGTWKKIKKLRKYKNINYDGVEVEFKDDDTIIILMYRDWKDHYIGIEECCFYDDYRLLKDQSKPLREER